MSFFSKLIRRLEVPHPANEARPTALTSHDVKPIEKERRSWGWPAFGGLWAVVAFNMSGFQLGSALLAVGLSYWQVFIGTLIGHLFGAAYVVAMSMPGLQYQISFPVAMRVAWGFIGSIFVVLNRILLSVVSTGVQNYQGGFLTYAMLRSMWPSIDNIPNTLPASTGMTLPIFIGVIVYFFIQLPLVFLSPKNLRVLLYIGGISGFLVQFCLVTWACSTMGEAGFGSTLSGSSKLDGSALGWIFMYSISFTISSVTGGSVAMCDYARFGKSVSGGVWPLLMGWFPTWLASSFGVLTIAATQKRYGAALWSVPSLLIAIQSANPDSKTRCAVFFTSLAFLASQLALNVSGNTFAGGTDIASLFPKFINIRRGQIIVACLGIAINPWYLLSSAVVFITVYSSYTVFIQPFMGIMIAHYFIIQKRRIKVEDLYKLNQESIYFYNFGINWRAAIAWLSGIAISLPGFLVIVGIKLDVARAASDIYYLCGLTGAIVSFSVTLGLHYIFPVDAQLSWISSVSIEEAHALKEDYISSLEIDIIALERQENDSIERLSTHLSRYGEKTVGY